MVAFKSVTLNENCQVVKRVGNVSVSDCCMDSAVISVVNVVLLCHNEKTHARLHYYKVTIVF